MKSLMIRLFLVFSILQSNNGFAQLDCRTGDSCLKCCETTVSDLKALKAACVQAQNLDLKDREAYFKLTAKTVKSFAIDVSFFPGYCNVDTLTKEIHYADCKASCK